MINLDSRFVKEDMKLIGPKGVAVLLAISVHLDNRMSAFPSKATLKKYTGMGRDSINDTLKDLELKGFLKKEQRKSAKTGKFSSNLYTVTSKYIGVFITANDLPFDGANGDDDGVPPRDTAPPEPCTENRPCAENQYTVPCTENQYTVPCTENQYTKELTNSSLSINQQIAIANSGGEDFSKKFCWPSRLLERGLHNLRSVLLESSEEAHTPAVEFFWNEYQNFLSDYRRDVYANIAPFEKNLSSVLTVLSLADKCCCDIGGYVSPDLSLEGLKTAYSDFLKKSLEMRAGRAKVVYLLENYRYLLTGTYVNQQEAPVASNVPVDDPFVVTVWLDNEKKTVDLKNLRGNAALWEKRDDLWEVYKKAYMGKYSSDYDKDKRESMTKGKTIDLFLVWLESLHYKKVIEREIGEAVPNDPEVLFRQICRNAEHIRDFKLKSMLSTKDRERYQVIKVAMRQERAKRVLAAEKAKRIEETESGTAGYMPDTVVKLRKKLEVKNAVQALKQPTEEELAEIQHKEKLERERRIALKRKKFGHLAPLPEQGQAQNIFP